MREVTDPALLSQLNAPSQGATGGMRPVEDPAILAQLNAPAQEDKQPKEQPWWDRSDVSARAGKALLNQRSPFTPAPTEKNLNIAEEVGSGLMDYAPYLMGASGLVKGGATALAKSPAMLEKAAAFAAKNPKLAKYLPQAAENMIGGAGYGAATAPDGSRIQNALTSAAMGGGATLLSGGLIDPALRYGAQRYAQSAIPVFTKKATEKLRELLPVDQYVQKLSERFRGAAGKNKANWTSLENTAKTLDENVPRGVSAGFNQAPYQNYIEQYGNKIKGMEPAIKEPYMQSLDIAQKATEMAPQSFEGAVALRKNINQNMKDYLNKGGTAINPQNNQSKNFLSGLKQNLKNETIAAQEGRVAPEALNQFKNEWEAANQSHQDLQKFFKSPNKMTGVENEGKVLREAYKSSLPKEMGGTETPIDPAILSKYVPSLSPEGAKGIEGLKHLEKLMGNKEDAVNAAKSHIFGKQITNGANTVDSAAKYAQLSEPQKKYLFGNSEEGKMLESINNYRLKYDREPEKTLSKIGHGFMGWGVPGILGYEASEAAGESKAASLRHALEAVALARGIKYGAQNFATVPRVNRAIDFGKTGTTNNDRRLNALAQIFMNQPQQGNR